MSDFGTVTEELRLNRLEQKKVTNLTEKLLAEKKLDDSAAQILKGAIPEIAAEAFFAEKIVKGEGDESDEILKSLLDIQFSSALTANGFYAEIFAFLRNRFGADNIEREVLDNAAKKFEEMNKNLTEFRRTLEKKGNMEFKIFEDIKKNTEETADNINKAAENGFDSDRPDPLGADKLNQNPLMRFFSGKFPKMIFSVVGGLFSKTIGFIGGLASSAKDFLFKIGGKFVKIFKDTLGFLLKPFKVIFDQAGNIFGGILTIILLNALIDFLRSPLWKNNKDGIAALIGKGIQFTLDGIMTTFDIVTDYFMNTFLPAFDRFIYSFLDSPIVRGVAKVSGIEYSDEVEDYISLVAKGGVQDKIKKIEDEIAFLERTGPYMGGDKLEGDFTDERRKKFGGFMGVLRTRERLDKDLDDLRALLPEQRQITRNIDRIMEQQGGVTGGGAVVMTNQVRNDVMNYAISQKSILQHGSGLIKALIESYR